MPELVPVRVRDCACPDAPHVAEGDVVYLAPHLDIDGGIEAERDLVESAGNERTLTRRWLRTFITYGAKGWNVVDEAGEPVPFDVSDILSDWALARPLGDVASNLYTESITAPFVKAQAARSPTGPTADTTSPTPRRTRRSPA
jgi:hypothetical protein